MGKHAFTFKINISHGTMNQLGKPRSNIEKSVDIPISTMVVYHVNIPLNDLAKCFGHLATLKKQTSKQTWLLKQGFPFSLTPKPPEKHETKTWKTNLLRLYDATAGLKQVFLVVSSSFPTELRLETWGCSNVHSGFHRRFAPNDIWTSEVLHEDDLSKLAKCRETPLKTTTTNKVLKKKQPTCFSWKKKVNWLVVSTPSEKY